MRKLAFAILLLTSATCWADDITITVMDQDALDAINTIIATNGLGEQPSDIVADIIVPQLVIIRGQQITNAAQAKAATDPNVLAFSQRQADKIAAQAAKIVPSPAQPAIKTMP